jgi:hypothetical protein
VTPLFDRTRILNPNSLSRVSIILVIPDWVYPISRAVSVGFADEHRVLVEPACGASLSVVYDNDDVLEKYRNIVVIVCGGSKVDLDQIAEWKKA